MDTIGSETSFQVTSCGALNLQGFWVSEYCQFLTLAQAVPAPSTGKLTASSGVLLKDRAFGDPVGVGLIKFPTVHVPAVRGSFETGGVILENAVAE